jgi:hypothetical protein
MARGRRYYSGHDDEVGVTPSRLKRMSRARQREYMLHWFHRMFEDPTNETPYNGEEGGFIYVWGGPYDAREQLADEFYGIVPDELIDEVVEEVESDGITDWAPGPAHPDHQRAAEEFEAEFGDREGPEPEPDLDLIIHDLERGRRPSYGDQYELDRRKEIVAKLDELRRLLTPAKPKHGSIGHNNPPPDDSPQVKTVDELREAATVIEAELKKPAPDALEVAKSTSRLRAVLGWFGKKLDTYAETFVKEIASASAKAVVVIGGASYVHPPLGALIIDIIKGATAWLAHVTMPF